MNEIYNFIDALRHDLKCTTYNLFFNDIIIFINNNIGIFNDIKLNIREFFMLKKSFFYGLTTLTNINSFYYLLGNT